MLNAMHTFREARYGTSSFLMTHSRTILTKQPKNFFTTSRSTAGPLLFSKHHRGRLLPKRTKVFTCIGSAV